jgi:hypothetical protein
MIDFINLRVREGRPIKRALVEAGTQRLRPVCLTSVTTVAGLLPILLERSYQAQIVIPMATSLAFGLMASTVLVLFLVPAMYYVYALASGGAAVAAAGIAHKETADGEPISAAPAARAAAALATRAIGNGENGDGSNVGHRTKDDRVGSAE